MPSSCDDIRLHLDTQHPTIPADGVPRNADLVVAVLGIAGSLVTPSFKYFSWFLGRSSVSSVTGEDDPEPRYSKQGRPVLGQFSGLCVDGRNTA